MLSKNDLKNKEERKNKDPMVLRKLKKLREANRRLFWRLSYLFRYMSWYYLQNYRKNKEIQRRLVRDFPLDPRGFCIIRTQGKRIDLLVEAVISVQTQNIMITPCIIVHGREDMFDFVKKNVLRELSPRSGVDLIFLNAPDVSRRRGYPCNVGLDYLAKNSKIYDFFCFLDDDDYLLQNFSLLADTIRKSKSDFAYGSTKAVPTKGGSYTQHFLMPSMALFCDNFIPVHSYIVRTEVLIDTGIRFDEEIDYFEDWDFLVQLVGHGILAAALFLVVSEYRLIGDGNAVEKKNPEYAKYCSSLVQTRAVLAAKKVSINKFWEDVFSFQIHLGRRFTKKEMLTLLRAKDIITGKNIFP